MLSKVYIFDIRDNSILFYKGPRGVVNCFQKFISLILETTGMQKKLAGYRCELLSKVYIFDIRDNFYKLINYNLNVVNCFQKFISLILETTNSSLDVLNCLL